MEGDALRQLTNTPDAYEKWPAWSPDGQRIAFARMGNTSRALLTVSALGGAERMIAERGKETSWMPHVAWLPDSRSLVMTWPTRRGRSGLVHHVLETDVRRQLTEAPDGFIDAHPRVSPDGAMVAFERDGAGRTGLFVLPMSGGEPMQIGAWASGVMGGLTWTPDGAEVLFARPELSGRRLLRARADGRTPATPVTAVSHGAIGPSVSQYRAGGKYRLALMTGQPDMGLRIIDLQPQQRGSGTIAGDVPFSDSTRMDVPGRFSPDGRAVAFASDRGGSQQVWVAQRDGSGLRSITELEDASVNVGAWSPDGASVLFDATVRGNTDLYVARADGGPSRRLTASAAAEFDGEWSRDGAWIYYVSEQSGSPFIRRMPSAGGTGVQITSEPGFEPRELSDGRSIFFIDQRRDYGLGPGATLKRVSVCC